jgi:DNA recombination protein RmuC
MLETFLAVTATLLFAAIAAAVFLMLSLRQTRAQQRQRTAQHEAERAEREAAVSAYAQRQGELERDLAVVTDQRQSAQDQLIEAKAEFNQRLTEEKRRYDAALDDAGKRLEQAFKSHAGQSLTAATDELLKRAQETLGSERKLGAAELKQREQAIASLIKPIQEKLAETQRATAELEQKREGAYQRLDQQLLALGHAQQRLGDQTTALATALRGSSGTRGRWGEMVLRRVAEMAGMTRYCDFDEQKTLTDGPDRLRPDMVVKLPSDRQIVVDAKSVFAAYKDACETPDEQERERLLDQHVRDIEGRVRELSSKAYTDRLDNTVEFVVLFIPGDSFLASAAQRKPELPEWAMGQRVVIATPTTLISLLKVIEMGWREEQLAENAKRIRDVGVELHERLSVVANHVEKLGKKVGDVVGAYDDFVGSFQSRVMPSARKLQDLGAGSSKELPADDAVGPLGVSPRRLKAEE